VGGGKPNIRLRWQKSCKSVAICAHNSWNTYFKAYSHQFNTLSYWPSLKTLGVFFW